MTPIPNQRTPNNPVFQPRFRVHRASTSRGLWAVLSAMRQSQSRFGSSAVRSRPARAAALPTLCHAFSESERTPNHALQRTAPRVTVAAIHVRSRPVRPWPCFTSVASFCAPPSQLPRRAPQSLSLRSLGGITHHTKSKVCENKQRVCYWPARLHWPSPVVRRGIIRQHMITRLSPAVLEAVHRLCRRLRSSLSKQRRRVGR